MNPVKPEIDMVIVADRYSLETAIIVGFNPCHARKGCHRLMDYGLEGSACYELHLVSDKEDRVHYHKCSLCFHPINHKRKNDFFTWDLPQPDISD